MLKLAGNTINAIGALLPKHDETELLLVSRVLYHMPPCKIGDGDGSTNRDDDRLRALEHEY